MTTAVEVTIAMFMAGVIFQSGRFSARLDALEEWRRTLDGKLDHINGGIAELVTLFKNGGPS